MSFYSPRSKDFQNFPACFQGLQAFKGFDDFILQISQVLVDQRFQKGICALKVLIIQRFFSKTIFKAFKLTGTKGFKNPSFTIPDSKGFKVFKGVQWFKSLRASRAIGYHLSASTLVCAPTYHLLLVAV